MQGSNNNFSLSRHPVKISEVLMAKIASFRGWRYNPATVGDLNKVVTQPYDKIDDKLREEYLQRSEYNVVRIIKGPTFPADTRNDNQYTRAAKFWEEWIEERFFVREAGPAIYPYFQEFTVDGKTYTRKGVIALVDLSDKKLAVRAHEHTLTGPKADRLKLMRATEANDGQIFMLYNDAQMAINNYIDSAVMGSAPVMSVKDDFGATHKLFRITSPGLVRDISEVFENLELFIADGHHRFETAVNYMNECLERNWKPVGVETFTHRMMTMVNMHDPGLVVLPTHRIVHSLKGFTPQDFIKRIKDDFEVLEFSDRSALYKAQDEAGEVGKVAIGFGAEGINGCFLFILKDPTMMDKLVTEPHCEAWRRLDVTVLHTAILERLLGIDKEKLAAESNIHYIRGRDESLDVVGKNGCQTQS